MYAKGPKIVEKCKYYDVRKGQVTTKREICTFVLFIRIQKTFVWGWVGWGRGGQSLVCLALQRIKSEHIGCHEYSPLLPQWHHFHFYACLSLPTVRLFGKCFSERNWICLNWTKFTGFQYEDEIATSIYRLANFVKSLLSKQKYWNGEACWRCLEEGITWIS